MENKKKLGYAGIIILLALLVNFIANYPQYQLSPVAYLLMPDFNMSVAQFSSLFSASMIPGILLGIISGMLCDKYGVKACIGIAGIVSFLGLMGRIFASNFMSLFICMIVAGIVGTFLNSNLSKIIGTWFPPEKIGMGMGLALTGSTLAQAVGMSTTAMFPSYHIAFIFAAALSAVVIVVWFVFMKNKPDNSAIGDLPTVPMMEGLKKSLQSKNVWIAGISAGFIMVGAMSLASLLPTALQSVRGMSDVAAGAISSAIQFGNIAGSILGPVICMKMGKIRYFLASFSILGAAGVVFAWLSPQGIIMTLGLFFTGFFISGVITMLMSVPAMLPEIGPLYAGSAGGMLGTLELLFGVVLTSYVITPIIGDNYKLLFNVAGVMVLGSGLLALLLPELFKKPKRKED